MNTNIFLQALNPQHFKLIIMPTERCNFRCKYCYEDFAIGHMSNAICQGIKNLVKHRATNGMSHLSVEYFGGEPLLADKIVFDLADAFQKMSTMYGFSYTSHITTNAYKLNFSTFNSLVNFGVTAYQITLDGPSEIHDQQRVLANGRGTFKTIWNNLLAIRDSNLDAKIMLRVHCMPTTIEPTQELLQTIGHEFGDDHRFAVHLHEVSRLGGENDKNIPLFTAEKWQQTLNQLLKTLPVGIHERSDDREQLENYICYASKANSLIIRADGRIAKCTVALNDERNHIGDLKPDGSLDVDQSKFRSWLVGIAENRPEVMACPLPFLGKTKSKEPDHLRVH